MNGKIRSLAVTAFSLLILPWVCPSQRSTSNAIKQQERNSILVGLKFTKKHRNSLSKALSFVSGIDPNAYATGFLVGDGLVLTNYHVVSGKLSTPKKLLLGFKANDELDVEVYIDSCRAKVVKVDEAADLALLKICDSSKSAKRPKFQTDPAKDENLILVAQQVNQKIIRRGNFHGLYTYQGQQYWSARIDGQDGFSGSPVYNEKGEIVGVFSSYDSVNDVALMSPGVKAQKILADYDADLQSAPTPKD
ncbi:MAG: serine protease [Acidobacteriota bacterium]